MHCGKCGAQQPDENRFCSSCGANLTAPTGSPGVKPKKKMSGCLLAALIAAGAAVLMVPIAGIIAAIAIPNFLNAVDRGKQKRTMADLRTLGTAVESYAIEYDVYPRADNIDELRRLLSPEFIATAPTVDGWARPIQVVCTPEGYRLVSTGKDGVADGCGRGAMSTFNADICFENGQFNQWPDGTQR